MNLDIQLLASKLGEAARRGDLRECEKILSENSSVINIAVAISPLEGDSDNQNGFVNKGRTPLMWAILGKNSCEVVKLFLANGADVNAQDADGCTAMHHIFASCARFSSTALKVYELIKAKKPRLDLLNKDGKTPYQVKGYDPRVLPLSEASRGMIAHIDHDKCFRASALHLVGSTEDSGSDERHSWWHRFLFLMLKRSGNPRNYVSVICGAFLHFEAPPKDCSEYEGSLHFFMDEKERKVFYCHDTGLAPTLVISPEKFSVFAEKFDALFPDREEVLQDTFERRLWANGIVMTPETMRELGLLDMPDATRKDPPTEQREAFLGVELMSHPLAQLRQIYQCVKSASPDVQEIIFSIFQEGIGVCPQGVEGRINKMFSEIVTRTTSLTSMYDLLWLYRERIIKDGVFGSDEIFNEIHLNNEMTSLAAIAFGYTAQAPGDRSGEISMEQKISTLLEHFQEGFRYHRLKHGLREIFCERIAEFKPRLMIARPVCLLDNDSLFQSNDALEEYLGKPSTRLEYQGKYVYSRSLSEIYYVRENISPSEHRRVEWDKLTSHCLKKERFVSHPVLGDGDCGYTAFGITRVGAYELLQKNLNRISNFLKEVVKELLLREEFYNYLLYKEVISSHCTLQDIVQNLDHHANNSAVQQAFLDFDVRDKAFEGGWAHPATLQALAYIQGIEINIWQRDAQEKFVPHNVGGDNRYGHYKPEGATQRLDLLFVNNNHFERLEFELEMPADLEQRKEILGWQSINRDEHYLPSELDPIAKLFAELCPELKQAEIVDRLTESPECRVELEELSVELYLGIKVPPEWSLEELIEKWMERELFIHPIEKISEKDGVTFKLPSPHEEGDVLDFFQAHELSFEQFTHFYAEYLKRFSSQPFTSSLRNRLLHYYSIVGDASIIYYLLEQGASPDSLTTLRCVPEAQYIEKFKQFHERLGYRDFSLMQLLPREAAGSDDKETEDKCYKLPLIKSSWFLEKTPLIAAISSGNFSLARIYIERYHANVNQANRIGWTPLHELARCSRRIDEKFALEMLDLLLEKGANFQVALAVNNKGSEPPDYLPSDMADFNSAFRQRLLQLELDAAIREGNVKKVERVIYKKGDHWVMLGADLYEKLMMLLEQAISSTQDNAEKARYYFLRAKMFFEKKCFSNAIEDLLKIIREYNFSQIEYCTLLGKCYEGQENFIEAIKDEAYGWAIKNEFPRTPLKQKCIKSAACCYYKLGDHKKALECFNKVREDRLTPYDYYLRAKCRVLKYKELPDNFSSVDRESLKQLIVNDFIRGREEDEDELSYLLDLAEFNWSIGCEEEVFRLYKLVCENSHDVTQLSAFDRFLPPAQHYYNLAIHAADRDEAILNFERAKLRCAENFEYKDEISRRLIYDYSLRVEQRFQGTQSTDRRVDYQLVLQDCDRIISLLKADELANLNIYLARARCILLLGKNERKKDMITSFYMAVKIYKQCGDQSTDDSGKEKNYLAALEVINELMGYGIPRPVSEYHDCHQQLAEIYYRTKLDSKAISHLVCALAVSLGDGRAMERLKRFLPQSSEQSLEKREDVRDWLGLINFISDKLKNEPSFVHALEKVRGREIVLVIGPTGAGKSTLVNYFLGTRYRQQGRIDYDPSVAYHSGVKECAEVGESAVDSKTLVPGAYDVPEKEYCLCDLSGFGETRGAESAILSNIMSQVLIQAARDVRRVILTIDMNTVLAGKGAHLDDCFVILKHVLGDLTEQRLSEVEFLFTKLPSGVGVEALLEKYIRPKLNVEFSTGVSAEKEIALKVSQYLVEHPAQVMLVNVCDEGESAKRLMERLATPSGGRLRKGINMLSQERYTQSFMRKLAEAIRRYNKVQEEGAEFERKVIFYQQKIDQILTSQSSFHERRAYFNSNLEDLKYRRQSLQAELARTRSTLELHCEVSAALEVRLNELSGEVGKEVEKLREVKDAQQEKLNEVDEAFHRLTLEMSKIKMEEENFAKQKKEKELEVKKLGKLLHESIEKYLIFLEEKALLAPALESLLYLLEQLSQEDAVFNIFLEKYRSFLGGSLDANGGSHDGSSKVAQPCEKKDSYSAARSMGVFSVVCAMQASELGADSIVSSVEFSGAVPSIP